MNCKHLCWTLACILGLSLASGCRSKSERWNVVIVTFDTTRADHIGCYGDNRVQTPSLDQLASEGVLFENAFAAAPITLPSHSTIMTGKVPFVHGIRDNGLFVMDEGQTTLAEILADRGYRTAAAIGAFPLVSQFGLDQGFELYDDQLPQYFEDLAGLRKIKKERLFFDERKAARVNEAIFPWLTEHHRTPFFLWVHYFDPHHPHEPPPPYDQLYADSSYRGEIAYSDENFGALMSHLKALESYDNTLIIFTSDHGEGIGEHHENTHSMLLYNGTLHVPLIVKPPQGAKGLRIGQRVGTVDIFPTVLDHLGIQIPKQIQGRSLNPYLQIAESPMQPVPQYSETLSPRLSQGLGELRAFFDGDYKYIHGPRSELFDITKDPRELDNLITREPEVAARLKIMLQAYLDQHSIPNIDNSVAIDEETAERLVALGYIQSAGDKIGAIQEILREDGIPPQDRAGDNSAYSAAKNLLFAGDSIRAKAHIDDLLLTAPNNARYLEFRLQAEMQLNQFDQALQTAERLAQLKQGFPPAEKLLEMMGRIFIFQNKYPQALEKYLQSQALKESARGQYLLAQLHQVLGQNQAALHGLQRALELDPKYLPARLELGSHYALSGDAVKARQAFEQALSDHPYHARGFYNFGTFMVKSGELAESVAFFERAVELDPRYLKAYQALVDILVSMGLPELADTYFQILNNIAPQSPEAKIAKSILEIQ